MTFDPNTPAPPPEEGRNKGVFGLLILMAAIAIAAYYWLADRPATPDKVDTGSAPSALPVPPPAPPPGIR